MPKTTEAGVRTAPPGTLMTLNGLRGLAAACVMVFHRPAWFYPHFLLTDAYLAVDFFFLLSGFVLARAYLRRLGDGLGFAQFLSRRLQRLYPLTFLGAFLGLLLFFHDHHGRLPPLISIDVIATMLTLPTPWEPVSWYLDMPMWSLFYELVINIVFGLLLAYIGRKWIWGVLAISVIAFIAIYPQEYVEFQPASVEFLGHIVRVSSLFFLGVALEIASAKGFANRFRLGLIPGGLLLVATFMINDSAPGSSLLRLAAVVGLYPLIILGAAHHEPKGWMRRFASFSGDVSYPLYLLHVPFLAMLAGAALLTHHSKQPSSLVEALARFAIVILMSWLAFKAYDEPVRRVVGKWLDGGKRREVAALCEPAKLAAGVTSGLPAGRAAPGGPAGLA